MKIFKKICVNIQVANLLEALPMSKSNEKVFYAVGRGREIGIYNSWNECKVQTEGVCNAKYRKFNTFEEAEEFVNFWRNYSSGVKESDESKDLVSNVSSWKGFAVNGRRNHSSSNKAESVNSINVSHFSKIQNNFILGSQNNKEDCRNKSAVNAIPYTSPLSFMGFNFISLKNNNKKNKKLQNSLEIFKTRKPSKPVNKLFNQDDSERCNSDHSVDIESTKVQSLKLKAESKDFNSFKCKEHSSSNPTNALDVPSDSKHLMIPIQNSVLQSNSLNKSIKPSESYLVISNNDIAKTVRKEIVDVDYNDQNENSQSKEEMTKIRDKLISCLKMLESALKANIDQKSDDSGRLKNSLKTLLEEVFTNTNTNVNPQMEPEGNVDKICEEVQNCEMQPVESASSPRQRSPQKSCAHLQSPSFHSTCFEGGLDQKNVDVLALNLRLDSFEKRFDTFLKEIGAITSEITHLKAEIKELKESSKFTSDSGFRMSPKKGKDGLLQTTLNYESNAVKTSSSWFHSGQKSTSDSQTDSEKSKKPTLKRKLSGSDTSESFKRFADNVEEIDNFLSRIKTEAIDYASFTVDEDDYVEVYTDGAAHSNGLNCAKAGIGIWFGDNHPMNVAEAVVGRPTNSMAEIQAARVAIQLAVKAGISKLKIFTDSEFLINCATKWIDRWKKNGWILSTGGPVKNRKELEKLDKAASKISVRWEKVAGHAGIKGNETADRLANEGALKYSR